MEGTEPETALVVPATTQMAAPSIVLPVLGVEQTLAAFDAYTQLKTGLDRRMPGAIVAIGGKKHRTKTYWSAVCVAFNVNVECLKEDVVPIGEEDWGYVVTYKAIAPNGRAMVGDGACFASELVTRKRDASVHNVRSMAHTRAFCRSVSHLVGFGEVAAEDAEQQYEEERARPARVRRAEPPPVRAAPPPPPPRQAGRG